MAKKSYIGVDGKARQVKKWYFGVGGKARKVKKGYIGIGGVARPFMSGGELEYYGTITPLSVARTYLAGASAGGAYAVFAGGQTTNGIMGSSNISTTVDAYNSSLVKSTTSLLLGCTDLVGASVGDYALFAGGQNYSTGTLEEISTVQVVDSTLSRRTAASMSTGRGHDKFAGASVGDYALFAGHRTSSSVDAYKSPALTKTTASSGLSKVRYSLAGASVGDYALFAGGYNWNGSTSVNYNTVDAFNSSLVRSTPATITTRRYGIAGASAGGAYAVFAGGLSWDYSTTTDTSYALVHAYNSSLVRTTPTELPKATSGLVGTSVGDYAIFGGDSSVYVYDASLVRTTLTASVGRRGLAGASVGDYALFAGGHNSNQGVLSTVDAYSI